MAVVTAQNVSVNGLDLGPGTPYEVLEFNPYNASVRADDNDRAWDDGSWSGREFNAGRVVPLRLRIDATSDATWAQALQDLRYAMRAMNTEAELRWMLGTTEYLMYVRPRLIEPDTTETAYGKGYVACALRANNPKIYAASETVLTLGLPSVTGGLTVPITVPFTIGATVTSGSVKVTNNGIGDVTFKLRIDAFGLPLPQPRVSLLYPGVSQVWRYTTTLDAGQWLDVDTGARSVVLNGTAQRRGYASGPWLTLPPKTTADLAFDAGAYSAVAQLTVTKRDVV
jgi:hypothetical protein